MKDWYKSKTIWISVIALAVGILNTTQDWLSQDAEWTVLLFAILNAVVRWGGTDEPITSPVRSLDALRPNIARKKVSGYYGSEAKEK